MHHQLCRLVGRQTGVMHLGVHRFDHDNGVVDDDADGHHQSEERDEVDGDAHHLHQEEGSDEGDRNRERRDECRPDVAQEDENHQRDEDKRLDEGVENLFEGCVEEARDVVGNLVIHSRREGFRFELGELGFDLTDDVVGVTAVALLNHDRGRRAAVEVRVEIVELAA